MREDYKTGWSDNFEKPSKIHWMEFVEDLADCHRVEEAYVQRLER